MDLIEFAQKKGLTLHTCETALKLAIEEVFYRTYGISSVKYDVENNLINVSYRIPLDMSLSVAETYDESILNGEILNVDHPLGEFSTQFLEEINKYFADAVDTLGLREKREAWLKRKHTIMDGEILSVKPDFVLVQIGYEVAIMPKKYFVPTEAVANLYKPGKILKFYIAKIECIPTLCIYVSRKSPHLPALILKASLPWFIFNCSHRHIGHISHIKTNAPLNKKLFEIRDSVTKELNNEFIHFNTIV
jgi:hypothetical protein